MSKLISKIVVPDSNEATGYSLYNVKDSGAIHSSDVGVAGGVASLDNTGKVPSSQLPSYVDDVVEGYYHENKFYTTYTPGQEEEDPGTYSGEITAETGKIYIDIPTNQSYRWSGSAYIVISSPYVLPTASANTLGGVKVGDNLSIDQNGVLSAQASYEAKTNEENGNGIGTCSTSSGTALTVSLTGYELVTNGFVAVTFTNDVPASATLNINGKGAKPIYYKGSAITADTIKADDTVMFAYDGTNYVVTSLGGGGTIVLPEYVSINLTSTESNNDPNLIGATIVVTDDNTSETILSTTWQGESIAVQVDEGSDYTITVGNVADYFINPNHKSYTAMGGTMRSVNFEYIGGVVDLGLPSGTLWCTKDVGSNTPWGRGLYFSWGNIVGHAYDSGYEFTQANYNNTPGHQLSGNIPVGDTFDAAYHYSNGKYRMPTYDECDELYQNCTFTSEILNGVVGLRVTSKITGYTNKSIFIPRQGTVMTSAQDYGTEVTIWLSTMKDASKGYQFYQNNSYIIWYYKTRDKSVGQCIRAVVNI